MKSQSRPIVLAVVLFTLVAGCTAVQQQKAQGPKADNLEFHNLQVFPQNISHDELINAMRFFTRSLGVKCGHCHAANPPGTKPEFDFPSDAKPEKNIARTMMRMTTKINSDYVSKVAEHDTKVTCMTCHRGKVTPNDFDPPPATPAGQTPRPQGQPAPATPTPQP
jgi:hypothetical protein